MKRVVLILSLLYLCAPTMTWAQEARANLGGRVLDQQGAVIPGATVAVTSVETRVRQQTVTNESGSWYVRFLNPGNYMISITATGFKTAERKGISLAVADDKLLDITLEIGQMSDTVSVTAEAPLIDTSSSISGTVIEPESVTEIPMMSRIPFLLATMSPGVQAQDQNQNVAMMWSVNAASEVSINGGRGTRSNEFLLDGMPNEKRDRVAYIPPTDAVAEFRVMSNAYDAQYGHQAGGTLNVSIKSGGSAYHGNVYEFHRNSSLNANLFQSNRSGQERPLAHYNLYGGTFGGPARLPKLYNGKDKTFFFVTWEGIRNKDPRFGTRSVPTELERSGDFNESFTTRLIAGSTVKVPITIFDPLTVDTRKTITVDGKLVANPTYGYRQPFANNRIPKERMSPIALAILKFVPLPNAASQPSGNAVSNFVPRSTRQNKMASFLTRVDHNWNNSHKSFVNVRWSHMDEFTGDDFANVTTGNYLTRINLGFGADHVWTISTNKIFNVRYSVARFEEPSYDHGRGFDPAQLGFPAGFLSTMEARSFPRIEGLFGNLGGSAGSFPMSTVHSWKADLTHIFGKMTFHYGGEYRIIQEADRSMGNQSGRFDFGSSGDWTRRRYDAGETGYGSNFAGFLLGLPSGGDFPRNANRFDSEHYYGLFFQNDWRATSRLTLSLGLRWDHQRPFIERFRRTTGGFDPTALNPVSDSAQAAYASVLDTVLKDSVKYPFGPQVAQLVPVSAFKIYGVQKFAGIGGAPVQSVNSEWDEWQPRVGVAYRIAQKTVIRGGFGRFTQGSGTKAGQNGFSRSTPLNTTQDSRITAYDTLDTPFRDGILDPTGSSLGPWTNLGQGVNWLNQEAKQPYSWEYSLHLQHEYKSWLFDVGYSHNKTCRIGWDLPGNNASYGLWSDLRKPRFDSTGKPLSKPFLWDEQVPNPFRGLQGVTGGRSTNQWISIGDLIRPIKMFGGQSIGENPWGKNQYDALEVKVQRRFRSGYSMLVSYTLSKLFEDTSIWGTDYFTPYTAEHKLGGEDRPHKISIAPIVELPVGRGKKLFSSIPKFVDAFIGGWEITGQYTVQSGAPVVFGTDSFYDGQDFHIERGERTLGKWFDTTHFVKFPNSNDDISLFPSWTGVQNLPGAGYVPKTSSDPKNGVYADFGTFLRRYPTRWANVRASRTNELNLGMYKNFRVRERYKIQVRGEAFNLFNHPRFGGPNTDPGSGSFGTVTPSQQNQARVIQVALKINF